MGKNSAPTSIMPKTTLRIPKTIGIYTETPKVYKYEIGAISSDITCTIESSSFQATENQKASTIGLENWSNIEGTTRRPYSTHVMSTYVNHPLHRPNPNLNTNTLSSLCPIWSPYMVTFRACHLSC